MEKSKLDRINELAHKSKKEGLTETEKEEQRLLRQEFLPKSGQMCAHRLNPLNLLRKQ